MLIRIHPDNPGERQLRQVVECLNDGGVIIYPTDTIYGIGCDIFQHKAVERIAKIKGVKSAKANFSFICYDLSHLSDFTKPINNTIYRMMKKALPGPYTFILDASNKVPKTIQSKRKSIGIRIPENNICLQIVKELGNPIMSTSVHDDDEVIEYTTDPELIYEKYKNQVDIVIDGGYGQNVASTIIDCRNNEIELIREGIGDISIIN